MPPILGLGRFSGRRSVLLVASRYEPGSEPPGELDIAGVASAFADPRRARVLMALADGRALPAGRLAQEACVSASTISNHLTVLLNHKLVAVEQQGRHRYYAWRPTMLRGPGSSRSPRATYSDHFPACPHPRPCGPERPDLLPPSRRAGRRCPVPAVHHGRLDRRR
ncbi:helix-turn-helix transcriptional regulator [Streptomyces sp. NPDC049954]|uniref:ArsR/SmtB family transcription factor n=1 Tax=Streptomyces sp. NPDC049954 TaxID=3155779 RepID=UPI0034489A0D